MFGKQSNYVLYTVRLSENKMLMIDDCGEKNSGLSLNSEKFIWMRNTDKLALDYRKEL